MGRYPVPRRPATGRRVWSAASAARRDPTHRQDVQAKAACAALSTTPSIANGWLTRSRAASFLRPSGCMLWHYARGKPKEEVQAARDVVITERLPPLTSDNGRRHGIIVELLPASQGSAGAYSQMDPPPCNWYNLPPPVEIATVAELLSSCCQPVQGELPVLQPNAPIAMQLIQLAAARRDGPRARVVIKLQPTRQRRSGVMPDASIAMHLIELVVGGGNDGVRRRIVVELGHVVEGVLPDAAIAEQHEPMLAAGRELSKQGVMVEREPTVGGRPVEPVDRVVALQLEQSAGAGNNRVRCGDVVDLLPAGDGRSRAYCQIDPAMCI